MCFCSKVIETFPAARVMVFQDDSNFCWKDASNPILCAFSHILAPNIEMLYYTNHSQIQLKNAAGDVVYTTLSM